MKETNNLFGVVLFFFILLFVYTKFIGPFPFNVNSVTTTKQNLFQVSGEGKVSAIPSTADISFGVTKQAATVSDASSQTNTAINAIFDAIKKLGIDTKDIKTTNYSVNPNYNFNSGSQTITGYSVTQNVDVKISPIEKANTVLDTFTANGANLIGQVSFGFDDKTLLDLQNKARKIAVDNAKQKAESLAAAAGMKLGKIIDVQENSAPTPIFQPLAAGIGAKAIVSDTTNVTPGENEVDSTITLSYETN